MSDTQPRSATSAHTCDRFVVVPPLFDDGRARGAHRGVFVGIVAGRNADRGLDAEQPPAERDALTVIAGGRRDDAARAFVRVERRHERQPVADLEGVGGLVILVFHDI